jgi:aryl-alcohol dehydrogenase-like predicted oxidoreductase
MERRKLGNSDLYITPIGLGAWALGGGGWYGGWGPQDDSDSIATIHCALDLGINWIDTAPYYGRGHSEEIVGKAIAGRRDEVILATKCGMVWNAASGKFDKRLTADSVRREVESSLRRLNTDLIDLYQIHMPAETDEETAEGWNTIADLIHEGKVRYGGVSNLSVAQHKRMQALHPITSSQPSYNMVMRADEVELLPYCAANNIGVIVARPVLGGLLTGTFTRETAANLPDDDWRKRRNWFQDPELSASLTLVEGLRPIAKRHDRTIAQLAIAWILRRPEVTSVIVGARQPAEIVEDLGASELRLSVEDLAEIDELVKRREQMLEPAQS